MYDVESHIAELYDIQQDFSQDINLIRKLIQDQKSLRILEPFCGTGRIILPLAQDGHFISGLDQAQSMLDHAAVKISRLPEDVQSRIELERMDVVEGSWPEGFDLVILAGNCFYELATADEQEICVKNAMKSLKPGGHIYIDNDHMEGELASSWTKPGVTESFPTGKCLDGTEMESHWEVIWYDVQQRLVRFKRSTRVTLPDGTSIQNEFVQQKHPVSINEVKTMLNSNDFTIEEIYGNWEGTVYTEKSQRAIFWAIKQQ